MKFESRHSRSCWLVAVGLVLLALPLSLPFSGALGGELTVEQLKDRVASVDVQERASLCLQISERQLEAAAKSFEAGEDERAQAALVDVVAFTGLARDYAIQSHKREKQSEIAVRKMIRKLDGLKHAVAHEDQKQISESIQHLEQVRDDLLAAMFPRVRK